MWRFLTVRRSLACSTIGLVSLGIGLPTAWSEQLASDLPGIARDVVAQVRNTHPDALLFKIRVERQERTQGSAEQRPSFYFFASTDRLLIEITGAPTARTEERLLYEPLDRLAPIPVPDFSVDLPQAVRTARSAGMLGPLATAELSVKVPIGRLPVLVWTLRSFSVTRPSARYFVDALTGASLTAQQVAGPIDGVDADLQASEDALRDALSNAVLRSQSEASPWLQYVVKPILEARNIFECNALGGTWTLLRMCVP